jgi:LPXTG-site transpeptidase (sortase) family protein
MNPLFADEPEEQPRQQDGGYVLPRKERRIEPGANPAVELIRNKIEALYAGEPSARKELAEDKQAPPRSKHQRFMHELSTSGKSLAEIQTAWHDYYIHLPDPEKREVWQEFYAANTQHASAYTRYVQHARPAAVHPDASHARQPAHPVPSHTAEAVEAHQPLRQQIVVSEHEALGTAPRHDHRSASTIKKQVLKKVRASHSAQLKAKQHLQSLAVGLGVGAFVILIFLFGFFNEVVIAPFIQPNNHAEATPIILSQDGLAPTNQPEVIIPKINVELPIIYGNSVKESDVESDLEDGVVHYASTGVPGQQGNAAFFGHSSNNIFNPGKYKFAFVLLHELVPGDIFYLTYNGKVYTYKVFQKQVVQPSDTWVLNPVQGHASTATLITCDPPGTSLHRLVVWADQISPDPSGNTSATPVATTQPAQLASNGPTLWSRFWHWATPW